MGFKKGKLVKTLAVGLATLGLAFGVTSCDFGTVDVDWYLPSDDPDSPVTIEFWHCLGQEKEGILQELVDEFNASEEGQYYQVVLVDKGGGYDELHDTMKTNLAANIVPAMAMGYPDSFAEYMTNNIDESFLLRLDNFINDEEFGYSDEELDDFVDEFLEEGQNYHFSGTWSMPMYKSTEVLYYNKGYFAGNNPQTQAVLGSDTTYNQYVRAVDDAGAAPSDEDLETLKEYVQNNGGYAYDVPETWDDMIATGRQMLSDRNAAGVTDYFVPIGYDSDSNMLITQFAQRDIPYTKLLEDGETTADHFQFVNDEAKDFVSDIYSLITEGVLTTKNTLGGNTYTSTYFNNQQVAMTIGSTGGSDYQVSAVFGVGLAPVPCYEDDNGNQNRLYIQQGPSICFFNNENEYIHKGAWLFYKFLADPDNNAYLALNNSYDPVRESSFTSEAYQTWISYAGRGDLLYDIPVITSTLRDNYMSSPVFVGSSTARDEIGNIITYITRQSLSIDEAFQAAYNACLQAS